MHNWCLSPTFLIISGYIVAPSVTKAILGNPDKDDSRNDFRTVLSKYFFYPLSNHWLED